jgi:serine/threonine protein kinase
MEILCGTLDYVSPEMVRESAYSEKGDLWNVGVLAYELIQGYAPFRGSSKSRIFEKVRKLEYSFS